MIPSVPFRSLPGVGDLLLTCTAPQSRNYSVGYRIAKGEAEQSLGAGDCKGRRWGVSWLTGCGFFLTPVSVSEFVVFGGLIWAKKMQLIFKCKGIGREVCFL